jgi:hypothetical protein
MVAYSAMISYLEKNNLNYFIFFPNSKAVICHLPPDMPVEDISNSLEDLVFYGINVRQMKVTQTAPNKQTPMAPLPLFLITLTRNRKSKFQLNSWITIKVDLYRAQTGFSKCYNCQNFGHVWA